jgi:anti-anti-sigma factor
MSDEIASLVTRKEHGRVTVLELTLQALRDAPTAYALRDQVLASLGTPLPEHLVLDLRHITSIGSMGFLVFLALRRQSESSRIVLCNVSEPIRDMFQACRLISDDPSAKMPFELAATLEKALDRLGD